MKVIASWLYPRQARYEAKEHNYEFHNNMPVAQIEVDERSDSLPLHVVPRYKVVCPVCIEEEGDF